VYLKELFEVRAIVGLGKVAIEALEPRNDDGEELLLASHVTHPQPTHHLRREFLHQIRILVGQHLRQLVLQHAKREERWCAIRVNESREGREASQHT